MNVISVWGGRWSTGEVLIADYKLKRDNTIIIGEGYGKGEYYLSGVFARQFPTEQMKTHKGKELTVRVVPLRELEKEIL